MLILTHYPKSNKNNLFILNLTLNPTPTFTPNMPEFNPNLNPIPETQAQNLKLEQKHQNNSLLPH